MKFYICKGCGKIVGMVRPSKCPVKCCGEPMEEMIPNTTDGALEKHVPVVEINGRDVTVTVGSVAGFAFPVIQTVNGVEMTWSLPFLMMQRNCQPCIFSVTVNHSR